MGSSEEGKAPKPENSSPPSLGPNNVQIYYDWARMQAYYGPRLAVPPYLNSTVAPHAPPPYMWGPPQGMISPYGGAYATFYAHGGIYAHPGIPFAGTGTTLGMETQVKPSGNTDGSFIKKLKEFGGLAMSIGNGSGHSAENGTDRRLSQSGETEGSSDGSDGAMNEAVKTSKKRSREGSPESADGKAQKEDGLTIRALEVGHSSEKLKDVVSIANVPVKTTEENIYPALKYQDSSNLNSSSTDVPQTSMPKRPNDDWIESDRERRRERRKLSNRESARRSRLKKQALSDELAAKVQSLTAENTTLKSEMNKLEESNEKLRLENATLLEMLKRAQLGQTEEANPEKMNDCMMNKQCGTVNLHARVNNSGSTNERRNEDGDSYENRSSATKLHQLLDSSPRTDAVAAS